MNMGRKRGLQEKLDGMETVEVHRTYEILKKINVLSVGK